MDFVCFPLAAGGEVPAVKAYDAYMKSAVVPFAAACENLGMAATGKLVVTAWEGIRTVIVLASRSKAPEKDDLAVTLQPHLATTLTAVKEIRELKLDRDFDGHMKAVAEMLVSLSWVLLQTPNQLPAGFVKGTLGSAEFWTNRIRKDFKGDEKQIAFCDTAKRVLAELADYIQAHHKTGLSFNPRGVSVAEAAILLSDEPSDVAELVKSPVNKRHPTLGNVVVGGNVAGIIGELSKRKTADGDSAATGLKHVGILELLERENLFLCVKGASYVIYTLYHK